VSGGGEGLAGDVESLHFSDGVPCPHCGTFNAANDDLFKSYFARHSVDCSRCGNPFDPWTKAIKWLASDQPASWTAFRLVGGTLTYIHVRLPANGGVEVDLTARGVPADAEILNIHATNVIRGEGAANLAALVLSGEMRFDPLPRSFVLYGAAHCKPDAHQTDVQLLVASVAAGADQISVHHYADAARQFAAGRYRTMVVSANIAVEAALTPALRSWLRRYCSNEDAGDLLGKDGVVYSKQLKILTKIAGKVLAIAELPSHIRRLLDELRRERNSVVHEGTVRKPTKDWPGLNKETAAELLAAAAFGYRYAHYLRDEVAKAAGGSPSAGRGQTGG
jgi:hypothetical protein